jgi:hypothetical protein
MEGAVIAAVVQRLHLFMLAGGECDARSCFTAMAVASALCLDVPSLVAKSGVVDYLRRCQVRLLHSPFLILSTSHFCFFSTQFGGRRFLLLAACCLLLLHQGCVYLCWWLGQAWWTTCGAAR